MRILLNQDMHDLVSDSNKNIVQSIQKYGTLSNFAHKIITVSVLQIN